MLQAKPQRCEVVAVGNDLAAVKVMPGDLVLFARHTGTELRLDGDDYLILDTAGLLAVITTRAAKTA